MQCKYLPGRIGQLSLLSDIQHNEVFKRPDEESPIWKRINNDLWLIVSKYGFDVPRTLQINQWPLARYLKKDNRFIIISV